MPRHGSSNAFKPKTLNERLEIKDHLASFNNRLAFLEKGMNSNLEIPG